MDHHIQNHGYIRTPAMECGDACGLYEYRVFDLVFHSQYHRVEPFDMAYLNLEFFAVRQVWQFLGLFQFARDGLLQKICLPACNALSASS